MHGVFFEVNCVERATQRRCTFEWFGVLKGVNAVTNDYRISLKVCHAVKHLFYELFNIILINFKNLYDLYGLILAT